MPESDTKGSKLVKGKKYMLIRYGRMGMLGWCSHEETQLPRTHTRVVIKSERGLELAEIVGSQCYKTGQFRMSDEQVEKYYRDSGADQHSIEVAGEFQRFATSQDIVEERKLAESAKEELESCRKAVREMNLDMKVVGAEHLFGGERIVFYFIAEGRVDFRDLVKRLAREYQTRIEMRQIGSRDEARLVGDYETCGLECCCKRFLKILKPVNMRMAKLQKATLDPSKISGHCGRLKCCLRYEDETYRDLRDRLPRKNTRVKSAHGEGRVVDAQVLTQLIIVQADDGSEFAVPLDEITIIGDAPRQDRRPDEQDPRSNDRRPCNECKSACHQEEPPPIGQDAQPEQQTQPADESDQNDNADEAPKQ